MKIDLARSTSSPPQSKDKARKWLHAIGIEPIPYMTLEALVEEPADCTPSPYQGFGGGGGKRAAADGGGGVEDGACAGLGSVCVSGGYTYLPT